MCNLIREGAWLHPNQKRALLCPGSGPSSNAFLWWDHLITGGEKPPGPSADSCCHPPKQLLSLEAAGALAVSMAGLGAKARHSGRGQVTATYTKHAFLPPTETPLQYQLHGHAKYIKKQKPPDLLPNSKKTPRHSLPSKSLIHWFIDSFINLPFKSKQGVSTYCAPGTWIPPKHPKFFDKSTWTCYPFTGYLLKS